MVRGAGLEPASHRFKGERLTVRHQPRMLPGGMHVPAGLSFLGNHRKPITSCLRRSSVAGSHRAAVHTKDCMPTTDSEQLANARSAGCTSRTCGVGLLALQVSRESNPTPLWIPGVSHPADSLSLQGRKAVFCKNPWGSPLDSSALARWCRCGPFAIRTGIEPVYAASTVRPRHQARHGPSGYSYLSTSRARSALAVPRTGQWFAKPFLFNGIHYRASILSVSIQRHEADSTALAAPLLR